ncbi:hypothetical protein [Streptomyces sp. NPDC056669]
MSAAFRIKCCRCRKNLPLAQDVYELDAEWRRRFPRMVGTLACSRCAEKTHWCCTNPDGSYSDDIPAAGARCFDAWSHISYSGSHQVMVLRLPRSGLLQGAEPYVRTVAARKGALAATVREALQEWDDKRRPATAGR